MFSPIEQYLAALGDIESSGNYGALGPVMPKTGDRAYGKYQVMGSNIPDWTEIATGTRMSPKDFLASPEAQDAVARKYFGGYVDQYGSPEAAASMWFSGKPNVNSGASDGYNTVPQYISKFRNALSRYQDGTPPLLSAYADANNSPAPGQGDGLSAIAAALNNPSAGIPPNVMNAAPPAARAPAAPDVADDPLLPQQLPIGPAGAPGSPLAGPVAPGAAAPAAPGAPPAPPMPLWLQSGQAGVPSSGGFPDQAPANSTPTQLAQADNGTASDATPPWAKMGLGGGLAGLGNSLQTAGAYLMGINNPAGGAAMVNAANQTALARMKLMIPEWGPIGTDRFGRTAYGWHRAIDGMVSGANGQAAGAAGASGTNDSTDYNSMSKDDQNTVDSMLAGKQPFPGPKMLTTPYWEQMLQAANARSLALGGSGFDGTKWLLRADTQKGYGPNGKEGVQLGALDTLDTHMEKASNAAENLNQSQWTLANEARNMIAMNTPLDPQHRDALNEWQNSTKALMDELGKAWKTGVLSDQEVNDWRARLSSSGSLQDMRRNLHDFEELVNGRRQTLLGTYGRVMDGALPPEYDGKQHERINKVIDDRFALGSAAGQPAQSAASGKPDKSQATATTQLGGKTYYKIGNTWYTE